jgi:hypothetical protein
MKIRLVGAALFQADGRADKQTEYRPAYRYDEANRHFS